MDRLNSQKQKAKDDKKTQKPKKKPVEIPGPVLEGNEDLVGMVASYQNGTLNMDRLYSEKQKKPSSFKVQLFYRAFLMECIYKT